MKYLFKESSRNELLKTLDKATARHVLNYGGAGSGKSVSQAQKVIIDGLRNSGIGWLITRKHATTLKDSVVPLVLSWVDKLEIKHRYNKTDRVLTLNNGSKYLFRGLDDTEKIKSIVGINRCWNEEASQLDLNTVLELNRRLRGVPDIQYFYTFNPISETHFLKTHFVDTVRDDVQLIRTTYKDNKFLTEEDRKFLEALKDYNYNQYKIYALGEWGGVENDSPFIYSFDRSKHIVENYQYNHSLPVYISFDFNVDPICCILAQHTSNKKAIRIFKEFRLRNSDIYELCKQILNVYPQAFFLVTGDASGKNRSAMARTGTNYYSIISKEMQVSKGNMTVPAANPSISNSRALTNAIFHYHQDIKIDKSCRYLITDIESVKATPTGDIDKSDGSLTHLMDCLRYYFWTYHGDFITNKHS